MRCLDCGSCETYARIKLSDWQEGYKGVFVCEKCHANFDFTLKRLSFPPNHIITGDPWFSEEHRLKYEEWIKNHSSKNSEKGGEN